MPRDSLEVEGDAGAPELDDNEPVFSETMGLDVLLTPVSAQLEMGLVCTSQTVVSGVAVTPSDSSMIETEASLHRSIGLQSEVLVGDGAAVAIKSDVAIATPPPEALRTAAGSGDATFASVKNSSPATDLALIPLAAQQSSLNAAAQEQLTRTESSLLYQPQSVEQALEPSKPVKVSETQKQYQSDTLINAGALPSTEGADLKAGEEAGSLTPKLDQIEAVKQETRQTPPSPASLPSAAPSYLASVVTEAQSMAPDFTDEVSEFAPVAPQRCRLSMQNRFYRPRHLKTCR